MKTFIAKSLFIFLLSALISCDKTEGLKKKLKGKYEIETLKESFIQIGCSGTGDYINYQVENPGTIIFTNKKTIQGPTTSSNKTFIGYFDYDYSTTDANGQTVKQTEKEVFQYEFLTHSTGDFDTVQIHLFDKTLKMDLLLDLDGNGDISAFKYQTYKNDCYIGTLEHIVKK